MREAADDLLGDQLLRIAGDADLRGRVYDHLREYCHQCRNRLNSLKLSIYLAMKQAGEPSSDRWTEVDQHYRDLEREVERIQFLCRPLSPSRVTLGLDLLIEDRRDMWERAMAEGGRELRMMPPAERGVASFDVDLLGRALDAVVASRAADRSAPGPARLRWWVDSGTAHVDWDESERDGAAGPAAPGEYPSSSDWALPILARVVEAHGGGYRIRDDRGWRLEISWPIQPMPARSTNALG